MNLVVSIQLLLQLDDSLVTLIQAAGQCNHDVTLFLKQTLVPVDLLLILFDLLTLSFDLRKFALVLLTNQTLLLLQSVAELRGVLDFTPAYQDLRVHGLNFLF